MRKALLLLLILFVSCTDTTSIKSSSKSEQMQSIDHPMDTTLIKMVTIILIDSVERNGIKTPLKMPFYTIKGTLGKYTYHEALKACEELGPGWQLPTVSYLVSSYETFDTCDVWFESRDAYRGVARSTYPGVARSTYRGMRKLLTRDTSMRIDVKPVKPVKK